MCSRTHNLHTEYTRTQFYIAMRHIRRTIVLHLSKWPASHEHHHLHPRPLYPRLGNECNSSDTPRHSSNNSRCPLYKNRPSHIQGINGSYIPPLGMRLV